MNNNSRVLRLEEEEEDGDMMEITTPESLESAISSCEEIGIVLGKDSDLPGLVNVMKKQHSISTAWSMEVSCPPQMGVPDWNQEPAKELFEALLQYNPKLSSLSISHFQGLPLCLLHHLWRSGCLETLDMELATVTFTTLEQQQQQPQQSSPSTTRQSLKHLSLNLSGSPCSIDWDGLIKALSIFASTTLSSVTVYEDLNDRFGRGGGRHHFFRHRRMFRRNQQHQPLDGSSSSNISTNGVDDIEAIARYREERKAQFARVRQVQNRFFQALGSLPTRELFLYQLRRNKAISLDGFITSLQSNCHLRELHLEWCIPLVEFILTQLIRLLDTTLTDNTSQLQILRLLQLKETPLGDTLIQLAHALTNNTTLKELHCVTKSKEGEQSPPAPVVVDDEDEEDDVQEENVISIGASIALEKLLQNNHHLKVLNFGELHHSPTVRFLLAVNTVRDALQTTTTTKDQRTIQLFTACANMKNDDDYDFHLSGLFYFLRRNPSHIVSQVRAAFSTTPSRKRKLGE